MSLLIVPLMSPNLNSCFCAAVLTSTAVSSNRTWRVSLGETATRSYDFFLGRAFDPLLAVVRSKRLAKRGIDLDGLKMLGQIGRLMKSTWFRRSVGDSCPIGIGPSGRANSCPSQDSFCFFGHANHCCTSTGMIVDATTGWSELLE